jgi:hypothetical protein
VQEPRAAELKGRHVNIGIEGDRRLSGHDSHAGILRSGGGRRPKCSPVGATAHVHTGRVLPACDVPGIAAGRPPRVRPFWVAMCPTFLAYRICGWLEARWLGDVAATPAARNTRSSTNSPPLSATVLVAKMHRNEAF